MRWSPRCTPALISEDSLLFLHRGCGYVGDTSGGGMPPTHAHRANSPSPAFTSTLDTPEGQVHAAMRGAARAPEGSSSPSQASQGCTLTSAGTGHPELPPSPLVMEPSQLATTS